MTIRKLKISELQNTKTKNFQSSQEEKQIPPLSPSPLPPTPKKKLKTTKMTRRKFE
jgi:hypothetical protein